MSTLIRKTFSVPPLGCNCSIIGDPAAAGLTLRSPRSMILEDQAEKFPDSKPSAKIRSDPVGVFDGVDEGPIVLVAVVVGVEVAVGVGVRVGVLVGVLVGPPGVLVGVFVGSGPVEIKLIASTSFADKPHVLPSK